MTEAHRFGLPEDREPGDFAEEAFFDTDESVERFIQRSIWDQREQEAIEMDEIVAGLQESLPSHLAVLGLKDPNSISTDDIETLVEEGYADVYDVENLYFDVWDEARAKLGPFARVKFKFMMEWAELPSRDPVAVKNRQEKEALENFTKLGIDENDFLDLRNSTDRQKRSLRRLSWLLTKEPALAEFNRALVKSKAKGEKVRLAKVAEYSAEVLKDTLDGAKSIDTAKLDSISKLAREGQIQLLGISLNVAQSVFEDLINRPQ